MFDIGHTVFQSLQPLGTEGLILAMICLFFVYMSAGMAETVTMGLAIGVIAISPVFSMAKRRKEGMAHESG